MDIYIKLSHYLMMDAEKKRKCGCASTTLIRFTGPSIRDPVAGMNAGFR
jgi:hypothetical protein